MKVVRVNVTDGSAGGGGSSTSEKSSVWSGGIRGVLMRWPVAAPNAVAAMAYLVLLALGYREYKLVSAFLLLPYEVVIYSIDSRHYLRGCGWWWW